MKISFVAAALLSAPATLFAQQPDTAQARRDSIALVRELERQAAADSSPRMSPRQQPVNPRMMPDISVIGDFVGDFSKASTQESGNRMNVREVELAIGANVDPYFRADFILGLHDEGIAIEEAYATAMALPAHLQARIGRFHMPFGKQNTTHRAELHTLEYPWAIQRFLGEEALKGTGVSVSRIGAPLGWYQELIVTGVEVVPGHAEHDEEGLVTEEPLSRDLANLTFSARLRNYWDLSEAANVELSASAMTGRRAQPFDFGAFDPQPEHNAVPARQRLYGGDVTFRWRPLQQGLYRSLIAQAELFYQANERIDNPNYLGPAGDFRGAYTFARWQLTRRWYLGGRYDWIEDPEALGANLTAASGYLQWFPSEFSKVNFGFERLMPTGLDATNRFLIQATFAIGPHRPHPF
jgi:hypothetical protein